MSYGRWWKAFYCIKCDARLNEAEYMYSSGVCPYCGYDSDSTVCHVRPRVMRRVYSFKASWWQKLIGIQDDYYLEEKYAEDGLDRMKKL